MNEGTKLTVVTKIEPSASPDGGMSIHYAEVELPPGTTILRVGSANMPMKVAFKVKPEQSPSST